MSWQVLKQGDKDYLLRCIFKNDQVILKLSDLVQFWSDSFSLKDVTTLFQEQNPLVEAPEASLVKYIKNILDINKSEVKVVKSEDCMKVSLQFTCNFQGIIFSLNLSMPLMEPHALYDDITVPLLLTVQNLQAHKKYLSDQLKKKDIEINEYKLEGYQISRKTVETVKFDESILSDLPLSGEDLESKKLLNIIPQCKIFDALYQLLEDKKTAEHSTKTANKNANTSCASSKIESLHNEDDSQVSKRQKLNH